MKKKLWAFGGGKGGVGKSIVSANIAISLAQKNSTVVIVDADLGAANMNGNSCKKSHRLSIGKVLSLNCITPTFPDF